MKTGVGIVAAFSAVALALIAGCGGGGGGSSTPANPVAAVQQRGTALEDAIKRENVDAVMQFYSVTWTNGVGDTPADLRAELESAFPLITYVDQQGQASYLVNNEGTEVVAGGDNTMRFRVDATGEIITLVGSGGDVWRKNGDKWFIVYSEGEYTVQAALRRIKPALP